MDWFTGSIPEAIAAAKSRNAIFVVYVHDSSEASKTTDDSLSQDEISATLNSDDFVAILLENGTEDAKQFSQIYPLVLVPSLFFISGQTGMPMEVLGGPLTPDTLQEKLTNVLPKKEGETNGAALTNQVPRAAPEPVTNNVQVKKKETEPKEPEAPAAAAAASVSAAGPSTNDKGMTKEAAAEVEKSGTADAENGSQLSDDVGGAEADIPLDQKVERAKILLAEKQAKEARKKSEDNKQKEKDRRKMGQEVVKHRQQQEEDNLRAAAMERKRDKEEDRLARERVKAQIATDRAEREARAAMFRGQQSAASSSSPETSTTRPPPPQSTPRPSTSNTTRLKFRLPSGLSSFAQFPASTTLSEVRRHIMDNMDLPFPAFTLASTVHQGAFRAEDEEASLRDLGLVPSAILAILPASGAGTVSRGGGGGLWDFLWFILAPITFILGILRRFMGGGGGERHTASANPDGPSEPKRPREEGSATTRNRPNTAYGNRGEGRLRREGNIYRFSNPDDEDDDENNTWNGNSTQQK